MPAKSGLSAKGQYPEVGDFKDNIRENISVDISDNIRNGNRGVSFYGDIQLSVWYNITR